MQAVCGMTNLQLQEDLATARVTRIVMDANSDAGSVLLEPSQLAAAQLVRVWCTTKTLPAQCQLWRRVADLQPQQSALASFFLKTTGTEHTELAQLGTLWDDLASLGSPNCLSLVQLEQIALPTWPADKAGPHPHRASPPRIVCFPTIVVLSVRHAAPASLLYHKLCLTKVEITCLLHQTWSMLSGILLFSRLNVRVELIHTKISMIVCKSDVPPSKLCTELDTHSVPVQVLKQLCR